MEKVEEFFDRGVLHAGHPPIVDYATLATSSKNLKAGTVLKSASGGLAPAGDSDTPCAVLLADVSEFYQPPERDVFPGLAAFDGVRGGKKRIHIGPGQCFDQFPVRQRTRLGGRFVKQ